MGLELLFTIKALVIFLLIIFIITSISAGICYDEFKLFGWWRVLKGYIGVLLVTLIYTFLTQKIKDKTFVDSFVGEIYLTYTWIALFVLPLVFFLLKSSKPTVGKIILTNCALVALIFILFFINRISSFDQIFNGDIISALIFSGFMILNVYVFCFAIDLNKILKKNI